jgi:hypothetical protein
LRVELDVRQRQRLHDSLDQLRRSDRLSSEWGRLLSRVSGVGGGYHALLAAAAMQRLDQRQPDHVSADLSEPVVLCPQLLQQGLLRNGLYGPTVWYLFGHGHTARVDAVRSGFQQVRSARLTCSAGPRRPDAQNFGERNADPERRAS